MGGLVYRTLRENVADAIRIKIVNRELEPGGRIVEQDLAVEFGISRGPVREALRQLEQEGLVEYTRNVGCSVRVITIEDVYEVYLLRANYEVAAVRLLGGIFPEEALDRMEGLLKKMSHVKLENYGEVFEHDREFHRAIVSMVGLPRMEKAWSELNYGTIITGYGDNVDKNKVIERQYPIHKAILDICRSGDEEAICRKISDHYMSTVKRLLKENGLTEEEFKYSLDFLVLG